jgi:branched-chain amino acid transport system ATP-binding protein
MPLLELKDVHARYGPIRALHGVSLTVDEGEVVALLGANGAGKTTTLRSISSMTRTSGDIVFDGRGIARRSPEYAARLGIAHVPEGRGLFPELTVWENLRMGAVGPGRGRGARLEEEAKRVVGYFPWIDRRRDQPAATLSGGEQQMLALGRALVSRPRLLMLDEPSLGLAPTVVRELFAIVHRLNEDEGLTVLVVEQNATIALDVASRAYVLEVGRVAVEGTSDELQRHEGVRKSYLGY